MAASTRRRRHHRLSLAACTWYFLKDEAAAFDAAVAAGDHTTMAGMLRATRRFALADEPDVPGVPRAAHLGLRPVRVLADDHDGIEDGPAGSQPPSSASPAGLLAPADLTGPSALLDAAAHAR